MTAGCDRAGCPAKIAIPPKENFARVMFDAGWLIVERPGSWDIDTYCPEHA